MDKIMMDEIWNEIKKLEGKTIFTLGKQQIRNDIKKVDDKKLIRHSFSKNARSNNPIQRSKFEKVAERIIKDGSISLKEIGQIAKPSSIISAVLVETGYFIDYKVNNNLHIKTYDKNKLINNIDEINITETEREILTKTRIGHSEYKNRLLELDGKCRICNLMDENYLIASHIKPWAKSNDKEKLDINNGLLLCPNHDYLFDRNKISFDDLGNILISKDIDSETKKLLNIDEDIKISLNDDEEKYMDYHRNIFYELEKDK